MGFRENKLAVEDGILKRAKLKGSDLQCNLLVLCSFLEITFSPILTDF